jgi:hypothetical protein
MSTEPTILVKKSDGTSVRVPLSSLGKVGDVAEVTNNKEQVVQVVEQQKDQKVEEFQSPILSSRSLSSEVAPSLPTPTTPHELATVTPVDHFFENVSKARAWTADDHVSPLEDQLPVSDAIEVDAVMPDSRYDDVRQVVEALSFAIPTTLHSRLHSLIQSRVKDVRSDSQVVQYATNAVAQGGLGLDSDQADMLVSAIHSVLAVKKETTIPAPRTTPFAQSPREVATEQVRTAPPIPESVQKQVASAPTTRSLSDIHPPEPVQRAHMGPIDELASMTVVDFRRLSKDPRKAVSVLQDKLQTMRNESYMEYVKMGQAWVRSPLYRAYLSYLEASLDQGQSLQDVLSGTEMTPEDITVLSEFSEHVRST